MTAPSPTHSRTLIRRIGHGKRVYELARQRSEALAALNHYSISVPERVFAREGGEVVAVVPHVPGVDVETLLRTRGGLSAGECVTLGVAVAEALSVMHARKLPHGDISAANVMVGDGAVVLVDTVSGALEGERGTAPYAAPERAQGATPAGDIYSLGQLLLEAVNDADSDVIAAWAEPMVAEDPQGRPHAAMVARALTSCAPPAPVDVPLLGVVTELRERAAASRPRTVRLASGKAWRIRRAVIRVGVSTLVLGTMVVAAVAVAPRVAAVIDPPQQPTFDPPMPIPATAAVSVKEGAAAATESRFEALATGDPDALIATTAPGSPARDSVTPQADALRKGILAYGALEASVTNVDVLSTVARRATVVVTYEVSAHTVTYGDDTEEYASYAQQVELDLTWTEAGWQVERARPLI